VRGKQLKASESNMNKESEFPFERARRVTSQEHEQFKEAISSQFGINLKNRGRPPKNQEEKYEPISIRIHPKVLAWVKEEANKRGIGYQTIINEILLQQIREEV